MSAREKFGWLLFAFCLGLALGLILANRRPPPPPRKSKSARPMATRHNISSLDDLQETG